MRSVANGHGCKGYLTSNYWYAITIGTVTKDQEYLFSQWKEEQRIPSDSFLTTGEEFIEKIKPIEVKTPEEPEKNNQENKKTKLTPLQRMQYPEDCLNVPRGEQQRHLSFNKDGDYTASFHCYNFYVPEYEIGIATLNNLEGNSNYDIEIFEYKPSPNLVKSGYNTGKTQELLPFGEILNGKISDKWYQVMVFDHDGDREGKAELWLHYVNYGSILKGGFRGFAQAIAEDAFKEVLEELCNCDLDGNSNNIINGENISRAATLALASIQELNLAQTSASILVNEIVIGLQNAGVDSYTANIVTSALVEVFRDIYKHAD